MRVIVVDADGAARSALVGELRRLGLEVAFFADPSIAFLFLLGRLQELDGVLVNRDDEKRTASLLHRLALLHAPVPVLTYSGCDPADALAAAGRAAIA